MAATIASPGDSMTGIPSLVRDGRTNPIAIGVDTGPPPGAQVNAPQSQSTMPPWQPQTWAGEVARVTAQETVNYLKSRDDDPKDKPEHPRPWVGIIAAIGFTLAVLANAGLVVGAIMHENGNSKFEDGQARHYDALTKELAAVREDMAAHRMAIYALIDVLAKTQPDVRDVERNFRQ